MRNYNVCLSFQIIDFRCYKEKIPRYRNEKRILRNSNFYSDPLKEDTENCDYFQETLENIFKEVDDIKGESMLSSYTEAFNQYKSVLLYEYFRRVFYNDRF